MDGKSVHSRQTPEGLGHEAGYPILVILAGLDPLIQSLRGGIPEVVEIHRLRFGDDGGRPFPIGAGLQPFCGVVLSGDFERVQPLGAKFPTAEMPVRFEWHPSSVMESSEIDAMTDIPTAVAVVVLHSIGDGRVVVPIHALHHTIGVFAFHRLRSEVEKQLHFIAEHEAVGFRAGCRKGFVDERDQHIAGMRPHESLHGGGLPDAFLKLVAPDRAKEGEIGLQHEAETVARFVDLALNGVLSEAQEIQVRQLGEKDVVMELICIASEDAQVEIAHGIRASQANLATIEAKFSFRRRVFILLEAPHSKLPSAGIEQGIVSIHQLHLSLVEPRGFEIPEPRIRDG